MGWAGGGRIFDPVADVLVDMKLPPEQTTRVLTVLIKALCDDDWDTYDESYDVFHSVPEVVAAFDQAIPGHGLDLFDDE